MVAMQNYKLSIANLIIICIVALLSGCAPKTLGSAAWYGDIEQAKILINNGANVNEDYAGDSALHFAVSHNQVDIVRLLLDNGANVNKKNIVQQTPLKIATDNNYVEIVQLLLNRGAKMNSLDISLNWLPTIAVNGLDSIDITALRNKKIIIKPVTDNRKDQGEIGRNIELKKSEGPRLVTTNDNIAKWLTEKFTQVLTEFDITTVQNSGDLIIESAVLKFYVTESSTYKTDIDLNIKLRSGEGKVLWEGMITGRANDWGKSYKENNYIQGLSNACINLVYNMLKNEQIKQAVKAAL